MQWRWRSTGSRIIKAAILRDTELETTVLRCDTVWCTVPVPACNPVGMFEKKQWFAYVKTPTAALHYALTVKQNYCHFPPCNIIIQFKKRKTNEKKAVQCADDS